jgi:hypothetical protein
MHELVHAKMDYIMSSMVCVCDFVERSVCALTTITAEITCVLDIIRVCGWISACHTRR